MKSRIRCKLMSSALSLLLFIECGPMPIIAILAAPTTAPGFAGHPLPVDIEHGQLTIPSVDLRIGTDKLPLMLRRVHRSGEPSSKPGVFGHVVRLVTLRRPFQLAGGDRDGAER